MFHFNKHGNMKVYFRLTKKKTPTDDLHVSTTHLQEVEACPKSSGPFKCKGNKALQPQVFSGGMPRGSLSVRLNRLSPWRKQLWGDDTPHVCGSLKQMDCFRKPTVESFWVTVKWTCLNPRLPSNFLRYVCFHIYTKTVFKDGKLSYFCSTANTHKHI